MDNFLCERVKTREEQKCSLIRTDETGQNMRQIKSTAEPRTHEFRIHSVSRRTDAVFMVFPKPPKNT